MRWIEYGASGISANHFSTRAHSLRTSGASGVSIQPTFSFSFSFVHIHLFPLVSCVGRTLAKKVIKEGVSKEHLTSAESTTPTRIRVMICPFYTLKLCPIYWPLDFYFSYIITSYAHENHNNLLVSAAMACLSDLTFWPISILFISTTRPNNK